MKYFCFLMGDVSDRGVHVDAVSRERAAAEFVRQRNERLQAIRAEVPEFTYVVVNGRVMTVKNGFAAEGLA
jgi:hypothetical protein